MDAHEVRRRAIAALRALAVGDAFGAAADGFTPDEVLELYEAPIGELIEPINPFPESYPDRQRAAIGAVTESALAAATTLLDDAHFDRDLHGDALGWAVPVGIMTAAGDTDGLVGRVGRFGEGAALPAGAAVAAAVSAAVGGFMGRDAIGLAALAADRAGSPPLAGAIATAAGAAQASGGPNAAVAVAGRVLPGPEPEAAVAFALGVAFGTQNVRRAIPQATNQGGAAALTSALAGAVCAALAPASNVESWSDEVEAVNGLDLSAIATRLAARRPPPPRAR